MSKSNFRAATKSAGKSRNILHDHPLMTKGGVHRKTTKAKRRAEKTALHKEWPLAIHRFG